MNLTDAINEVITTKKSISGTDIDLSMFSNGKWIKNIEFEEAHSHLVMHQSYDLFRDSGSDIDTIYCPDSIRIHFQYADHYSSRSANINKDDITITMDNVIKAISSEAADIKWRDDMAAQRAAREAEDKRENEIYLASPLALKLREFNNKFPIWFRFIGNGDYSKSYHEDINDPEEKILWIIRNKETLGHSIAKLSYLTGYDIFKRTKLGKLFPKFPILDDPEGHISIRYDHIPYKYEKWDDLVDQPDVSKALKVWLDYECHTFKTVPIWLFRGDFIHNVPEEVSKLFK